MPSKTGSGARSLAPLPVRAHPLVLGVVLFLASELMFFAALFAAFYDLRANHRVWPPPNVHLDVFSASVGTLLLFVASAVMVLATKAMDRGAFAAAKLFTASAIAAALGFVAIAVHSYSDYIKDGFYLGTSAYASIYWTMTGFHLVHVIVGIGILTALLAGMRSPALLANRRAGAEAMTYYWHFVFIVWLGIFGTIYFVR